MKKSRFTPVQIAGILKEFDYGKSVYRSGADSLIYLEDVLTEIKNGSPALQLFRPLVLYYDDSRING